MTAPYDQFAFAEESDLNGELLSVRYIRVQDAILWDENSKLHDIGGLIVSIEEHGFRDPPAWDSELGAIVEGNGRITALQMMERQGRQIPRGVALDDQERWCVPVLFGLDAESRIAATRYGIDHNNLTMAGGDFTVWDVARMWDTEQYIITLDHLANKGDMPVSLDFDDLQLLKDSKLRKVSEIPDDISKDSLSDGSSEKEPVDSLMNQQESKDYADGAVIIINIANFNLADDVFDAVSDLVAANPGWDAQVIRN